MYRAYYHPRMMRHQHDQRFAPLLLPFVTGTVFGLAASPFLWGGGRPFYPPYPPYPPYPAPYGYGYGGYPY